MPRKLQALLTMLLVLSSSVSAQSWSTGLTGFYDYQTHGRTPKHLSVNPANGHLHAIFMSSPDSSNIGPSRRTNYAYSTNQGISWNTFGNVWVPLQRSGFPSLTLGQGSIQGATIIVNQCSFPSGDSVVVHVDFPEGGAAFAELHPAPLRGDPPYSPDVACGTDGSIVVLGVLPGSQTLAVARTTDYMMWNPPHAIPGSSAINDRYLIESNSVGRVGVVFDGGLQGLQFWESTNNGETWPQASTQILPQIMVAGPDSFTLGFGLDFLYDWNEPFVVFGVKQINAAGDSAGIGFWSRATGFVLAAPHHQIPEVAHRMNKPQTYHSTVGYPAISLDVNRRVHFAFQAFQPETSAAGYNYSNIFVTTSYNHGTTWSYPLRATHTASLDERYPSSADWNPYWRMFLSYQQDPEPGSSVVGEHTPVRRVMQRFADFGLIETVEENLTRGYTLLQNYPNPFNPSTRIVYRVKNRESVSLRIYDVLGHEVATLVNEKKSPGEYIATWDGRNNAGVRVCSGIYFYRLEVHPVEGENASRTQQSFIETKKLVLLK